MKPTLLCLAAGLVVVPLVLHGLMRETPVHARSIMISSDCLANSGVPDAFGPGSTVGMVFVRAGKLHPDSAGWRPADWIAGQSGQTGAFWMDRTEVTNAQFAAFVQATGYVTDAEKEGAGAVFRAPLPAQSTRLEGDWWQWTEGADWRRPEGRQSVRRASPNEPVVLVTYADAQAYAAWLGRDLPTEAEWELAAGGGGTPELLERELGEPRDPGGRPVANYWQGIFPNLNTKEDGYATLAPVGCFPVNGYGLYDMIGNVWEMTSDRFSGAFQPHGQGEPSAAGQVGDAAASGADMRVIKGGSFLCAADYCQRYRSTARHPQDASLPTSHVGFRTVLRSSSSTGLRP
jgi:sulfatase modifying factor 1